jgi:hypothetical protein
MSITSVVNDTVTSVSLVNAQKPLPPTISSYSVGGLDDTALDPAGGQTVQINGTGFLPGATITFDGNAVAVVTYVSANQLTFTSPAKSAGTYTIYVVNADGGTAIYIPGIIYSVLPTWTTSAGSLGSVYETNNISTSVVASGDAPITYSLYSGSLPTGSTLYANGVITGTAPVDSSSTTYSFTIEAIDAQLQGSTRSFSLTINTDVVTWVTPAAGTTYTYPIDSAIANVTLSATDAAGYAVTYTANALPTGLSLTGANISGTPTVIADSSTLLTATAATTNRTATRTINWSITVANDPYFEYNTLLIPGASTTFVDDASTNNFAVTIAGDTKPNSFNPYTPGYYSNYFDGTGDYLTTSGTYTFGTSNFTIEGWINPGAYPGSGYSVIFGNITTGTGNTQLMLNVGTSGNIVFMTWNQVIITSSSTVPLNGWSHVAVSFDGTTYRIFINGTASGTSTTLYTFSTAGAGNVGYAGAAGISTFTGYISNLRVVQGTAVYTSAFTPPTTPLTAISGTSLLTCQSNRFIDNSTNAFTITVNGNTTVNSFDPFVPNSSYATYGSGYFDGTGDYLTLPSSSAFTFGTGDFTVEGWVYVTAHNGAGANGIFQQGTTAFPLSTTNTVAFGTFSTGQLWQIYANNTNTNSSATWAFNTWYHFAVVRSSGTTKLYINGVSVITVASDTTNYTGTYFGIGSIYGTGYSQLGYISDVRVVKGTAVYTTSFTPPTAPLTAIANTSLLTLQNNQSVNNNVFLDNSTNNFLVTRNGNATQGTFSPYGGNWSNYFDGSGDYLTVPNINFSTNAFTIEGWFCLTAAIGGTNTNFWGQDNGAGNTDKLICFIESTNIYWYINNGPLISAAHGGFSLNTWYHIAFVRSGTSANQCVIYKNGVALNSTAPAYGNISGISANFNIGYVGENYGSVFQGYISNFRVVNGTAIYTGNFTPPTTPLTSVTNTQLLTCQSNRLIDNSIRNSTVTKTGDTSVQRFSPFNPSSVTPTSYSGYFDGNGDYLNTPSNAAFGFGTGDFTIEGWYYFTGTISTYQRPWWFGDDNDNLEISSSVLRVGGASQGTLITGGTTILANTWYHIALTRASGSYKLWLNGTQQGSTASNSYNSSARTFTLMATSGGANPSTGYVSNLRIVKGTAVYTSNFTPSTTPLTAISGTSLLTCQSPTFIDNSTNNFTITAAGNSQPTQQNPFGYTSTATNGYTVSTIGGSAYLDGTGDYLSLPNNTAFNLGTNNFTIEFWFYALDVTINWYILGKGDAATAAGSSFAIANFGTTWSFYFNGSSTLTLTQPTIAAKTWTHIALVRTGSTITVYKNGTATTTGNIGAGSINSTSSPVYVGGYANLTPFSGYMSDFRFVNGTALYTSNFVPPSIPLTAVQNTSALNNMTSAGIYDASMMNNMETVGDAKLSTAVTKFGGSSMSFDGTGDWLTVPNSVNLQFGTGDFTVEFWAYVTGGSSYRGFVSKGSASTGWSIIINEFNYWAFSSTATNYGGSVIVTNNSWTHIAFTRSGTTTKLFVNGTQAYSTTLSTDYNQTNQMVIGAGRDTTIPMTGYIDDLRITKGYARYTSTFTPPTTPFQLY